MGFDAYSHFPEEDNIWFGPQDGDGLGTGVVSSKGTVGLGYSYPLETHSFVMGDSLVPNGHVFEETQEPDGDTD